MRSRCADCPRPSALTADAARSSNSAQELLASKHYRQNDLGLLFANRRLRPFSANKLREKKLRPLLRSLGIPIAGFHAFRHGVAITLIDKGAGITTVGAQLRHSDPRMTLGLYAHVVPQSQRDAVEEASACGTLSHAPMYSFKRKAATISPATGWCHSHLEHGKKLDGPCDGRQ